MKNIKYLSILLLSLVWGTSCEKQLENELNSTEAQDFILQSKFVNYEIVTLDAPSLFQEVSQQKEGKINFNLTVNNEVEWNLLMDDYKLFTDDYREVEITAYGEVDRNPDPVFYLYGLVMGTNEKTLAIVREETFTMRVFKNGGELIIEPLSRYLEASAKDQYIIYLNSDHLDQKKMVCEVEDESNDMNQSGMEKTAVTRNADISSLGEYSYYQEEGSNSWNYVSDGVFLGGARFWFYSDYDFKPELKYNGVYSWNVNVVTTLPATVNSVMNNWKSFQTNNSWLPQNDVKVLWTGYSVALNSGACCAGGAANQGTTCRDQANANMFIVHSSSGYVRDQLFAHELAHTIDASHNGGNGVMGNSSTAEFIQTAKNQMNSYLSSNDGCL